MSVAAAERNSLSKKRVVKPGKTRSIIEKHDPPSIDDVLGEDVNKAFSSLERQQQAEAKGQQGGGKPLTLDSIPSQPDPSGFSMGNRNADETGMAQPDPAAIALAEQKAAELKEEAENILNNARAEAEQLYEEARKEGFEEGMKQAEEAAKAEFSPLLMNIDNTIEKLSELRTVILRQNESEIIDLAIDIARKVIGAELEQNPITVAGVIRSALHKVDATEGITIKVSPAEYETLMKSVPEFLKNAWIVADSKVAKGGAVIDSETGSYDAQIESQLQEIEKKLKKESKKE